MDAVVDDDQTLTSAEERRDAHIRGALTAEGASLRENNETLRNEVLALRSDLQTVRNTLELVRGDLARAHDDHDETTNTLNRLRDDYEDMERRADATIDELRAKLSEQDDRQTPRRRKIARRDSGSTSLSLSRNQSSLSRADSPMLEDRAVSAPQPVNAPGHLLARLASHPSHRVDALPAIPSASSSTPSLTTGALLSRLTVDGQAEVPSSHVDLGDTHDVPTLPMPAYPPSPFIEPVGFHALLPVLYEAPDRSIVAADPTARLDANGNVDLDAHERYVLALGGIVNGQPAWRTMLIRKNHLRTAQAQTAMLARTPMPLTDLPSGGRNGVLISPENDPTTETEVTRLFARPDRAKFYIERIRATPPELRPVFHSRALERWEAQQATRRAEQRQHPEANKPTRRPEPSPDAPLAIWKKWLKATREFHGPESNYKYIGIPFLGQGYQKAHIEGAKALLSFLPLNSKRTSARFGPLRDAFLRVAAALLGVPERYPQTLAALQLTVAPARTSVFYSEALFADANHMGVNDVTRFLASAGVQPEAAESWRPWATAFIEMELEEHPNGTHAPILRQARDLAKARIAADPKWVLKNIHHDTPGNYNPELEQTRATRGPRQPKRQQEVGPSSLAATPEAGPSSLAATASEPHAHPAHPDDADPLVDSLNYYDSSGDYGSESGGEIMID
jgi:hypothetical protein